MRSGIPSLSSSGSHASPSASPSLFSCPGFQTSWQLSGPAAKARSGTPSPSVSTAMIGAGVGAGVGRGGVGAEGGWGGRVGGGGVGAEPVPAMKPVPPGEPPPPAEPVPASEPVPVPARPPVPAVSDGSTVVLAPGATVAQSLRSGASVGRGPAGSPASSFSRGAAGAPASGSGDSCWGLTSAKSSTRTPRAAAHGAVRRMPSRRDRAGELIGSTAMVWL